MQPERPGIPLFGVDVRRLEAFARRRPTRGFWRGTLRTAGCGGDVIRVRRGAGEGSRAEKVSMHNASMGRTTMRTVI
jgi:hypothetical protein